MAAGGLDCGAGCPQQGVKTREVEPQNQLEQNHVCLGPVIPRKLPLPFPLAPEDPENVRKTF